MIKTSLTERLKEKEALEGKELTRKETLKKLVLVRLILSNTPMLTGYGPMSAILSKLDFMINEVSDHNHSEQMEAVSKEECDTVKKVLALVPDETEDEARVKLAHRLEEKLFNPEIGN